MRETANKVIYLKDRVSDTGRYEVLDTDRYEINEQVGRGTWGSVYSGKDNVFGDKVAIKVLDPTDTAKEQMEERNLDPFKAMKKESRRREACSYIVPGEFDIDKKGTPFLVMPFYREFLYSVLDEDPIRQERIFVGNGMSEDKAYKLLEDIASGLSETHTKLKRVHGDLKPDNIAIDKDGRALLNDLGTSTCASLGRSVSPRDNMGFEYTRAYESFKKESHPSRASDSFSFGSLLYRLFTGEYVWEKELNNTKDPHIFFEELGSKKIDLLLKKKSKKLPRPLRKLFRKCSAYYSHERYWDGSGIKSGLEKVLENRTGWKWLKNHLRKVVLPITIPVAAISLLGILATFHEPKDIKIPIQKGPYFSMLSIQENTSAVFVREDLEDLPEIIQSRFLPQQKFLRNLTNNKNVAKLLETYRGTFDNYAGRCVFPYTKEQHKMYLTNTIPDERSALMNRGPLSIVAKSIEVGIREAQTPEGTIDLEDACAIARLGTMKVNRARYAANSRDFKNYISAKDFYDRYIIPEKEQAFLKTWLAYINETN